MNLNGIVFSQGYNSKIKYSYDPVIDWEEVSDDGKVLHRAYVMIDGVLQFEESFELTIVDVIEADANQLKALDGSNSVTFQPYDNTDVYTCTFSQTNSWFNVSSQSLWSFSIRLVVKSQASAENNVKNSLLLDGSQVITLPSSMVQYVHNNHDGDNIFVLFKCIASQDLGGGIISIGRHDFEYDNDPIWENASAFAAYFNLEGYDTTGVPFEDRTGLIWAIKNENNNSRQLGDVGVSNYGKNQAISVRLNSVNYGNSTTVDYNNNDGSSIFTTGGFTALASIMPDNSSHYLGSFVDKNGNPVGFKGSIYDVRMYACPTDRSLNDDEKQSFLAGNDFPLASTDMTLIYRYNFNNSLEDSSGNGFTAALVSGALNYKMIDFWLDAVHWYKLNEVTGTNVVDSQGSTDLTASTSISNMTTVGKFGNAFDFKGLYDIDASSLSLSPSRPRSASLWLKIESLPSTDETVFWIDNCRIRLRFADSGTRFEIAVSSSVNLRKAKTDTLILGEWNHMGLSYTGGDSYPTLWINGVEAEYDGTLAAGLLGYNTIGSRNGSYYLNSPIDDLYIIDRLHLTEEICAFIYNNGIGRQLSDGV